MKYKVSYKDGTFTTDSRNARMWLRELDTDRVTVTTTSGKFVCEGIRYIDGVVVNTIPER